MTATIGTSSSERLSVARTSFFHQEQRLIGRVDEQERAVILAVQRWARRNGPADAIAAAEENLRDAEQALALHRLTNPDGAR